MRFYMIFLIFNLSFSMRLALKLIILNLECIQQTYKKVQIIIIMNNWIEKNIIFPKINESHFKEQKIKQEAVIRSSIIKDLKKQKNSSLYNLKQIIPTTPSKNIINNERKLKTSSVRKNKKNRISNFFSEKTKHQNQQHEQSVNFINITQILEQRKQLLHSSPLNKMLKKLNLGNLQLVEQKQSIDQIANQHFRHPKRRYLKSKLMKSRTQPQQSQKSHKMLNFEGTRDEDCLRIKQATKFDYQQIAKSLETEKQIKRQQLIKKKHQKKVKENELKITSIKGWAHNQNQSTYLF